MTPALDGDGWPMGGWFGASWGAPVCDEDRHFPTPVGEPCAELCGGSIEPEDQGMLIPHLSTNTPPVLRAYHLTCWRRTALGMVGQ